MKTVIALNIALFALACEVARGQGLDTQPRITSSGGLAPSHKRYTARELTTIRVANMIRSQKSLATLDIPLLRRMGDGAAAEVLSIMKTRGPLSPREQQNVVQIVHKAFERPAAITKVANRTSPQASLELLDRISSATLDFGFKLQIADTRQFVIDATLPR